MAKKKTARSKGSAKKRAKSNQEDQPQLPMPAQRDLKHYISALDVADVRVKKETEARKKIYEAATACGITKVALDRGRSLAKRNPIDVKNELLQTSMVLQEMGSPVQFEVYDAKHGDPAKQAAVQGFADGKAAKDNDAGRYGYIKGSPAARAYAKAYEDGQADNISGIKQGGVVSLRAPNEGRAPIQH